MVIKQVFKNRTIKIGCMHRQFCIPANTISSFRFPFLTGQRDVVETLNFVKA